MLLLIDVQGVGYEVCAPISTICQLPSLGSVITLHTHLSVREDGHYLYGFLTEQERHLFRELIKVNGIGAKTALAVLSGLDPETFIRSVVESDFQMLSRIPGIGKKTAERIVIEMRDKLLSSEFSKVSGASASSALSGSFSPNAPAKQDALEALISLGYKQSEVLALLNEALKENQSLSSDQLIRTVLKKRG